MTQYVREVADFMDMSGQKRYTVKESIQKLVDRDAKFLAELGMHFSLVCEEVNHEFQQSYHNTIVNPGPGFLSNREHYIQALALLADDAIDSIYVICAFLNKLGIDADIVWYLVHQSNMAKGIDCEDCKGTGLRHIGDQQSLMLNKNECPTCNGIGRKVLKRADGKTLKPEGWQAPNEAILKLIQRDASNG